MSADADDLRYFYSAALGDTVEIPVTAAASAKNAEPLSPGRYLVHFGALTGTVWIRQGPHADVTATAGAPSMPLHADGVRAIEITVRLAPTRSGETSDFDGIAARCSAAGSATLYVTKISRGR